MKTSILFALVLMAGAAWAQPAAPLAFEVASVKVAGPLQRGRLFGMRGGPGTNDPGQISWNYATLQDVLLKAYDVMEYQVSGPPWLGSEHYDITAKVPAGTSAEQFRLMLQNLLSERFHLKLHRETREGTVYELTVGKNGPKFKPSAPEPASAAAPEADAAPPMSLKTGADGIVNLPASMHGKGHIGLAMAGSLQIRVGREDLGYLIERLTAALGRPVIDKTGLTGQYDYALKYARGIASAPAVRADGDAPVADDRPPDLFTALQSQLGLKLEAKKAAGEVLIINAADKVPTEN
jgi:uncharacterized protein (TIGR03435 family)